MNIKKNFLIFFTFFNCVTVQCAEKITSGQDTVLFEKDSQNEETSLNTKTLSDIYSDTSTSSAKKFKFSSNYDNTVGSTCSICFSKTTSELTCGNKDRSHIICHECSSILFLHPCPHDHTPPFDLTSSFLECAQEQSIEKCIQLEHILWDGCIIDLKDNNVATMFALPPISKHTEQERAFYLKWNNIKNSNNANLLMIGCAQPHTKCTSENSNTPESTPFCSSSITAWTHYCLEHNINIYAEDNLGHTALMLAMIHGHTSIAKLLIQYDQDSMTKIKFALASREKRNIVVDQYLHEISILLSQPYSFDNESSIVVLLQRLNIYPNLINEIITSYKWGIIHQMHSLIVTKKHLKKEYENGFIQAIKENNTELIELFSQCNIPGIPSEAGMEEALFSERLNPIALKNLCNWNSYHKSKIKDTSNNNLLMIAIINSNLPTASFLIDTDIDINAQNYLKETALMLAIKKQSQEIVEKILQHKDVKLDQKDKKDYTALMHAIEQDNIEILELVLNKIKSLPNHEDHLNTQNNLSLTPLLQAIDKNATSYVKLLLQHPVNINQTNNKLITPLMLASVKQNKEVVELLLSHENINLMTQDIDGNTLLQYATNNAKILDLILERIKTLPNYISYLNKTDKKGRNILFYLILRHTGQINYLTQIKSLLEAGVEIIKKDTDGNNICMFTSDIKVLKALNLFMQNHKAQFNESSVDDLFFNKNKEGLNLLHKAADEGNNDILDFLLKIRPLAINDQDLYGYTPLMKASKKGYKKTIELLFKYNPLIAITNTFGRNVIHIVQATNLNNKDEIVSDLIKYYNASERWVRFSLGKY